MYKNKKIGIIGGGNLGNNTWDLFARNNDVIVYDLIPEKCSPVGTIFNDILDCYIVIICISVPIVNGIIDTDIIIDLVGRLQNNKINKIILKTKIPPGTCDSLNTYYFPYFIKNKDIKDSIIFGIPKDNNEDDVKEWITKSIDSNVTFLSAIQTEIIILSTMSYLTVKFAFLKELQYYCKSIGIKFDEIENHLLNNEIILNLDEKKMKNTC